MVSDRTSASSFTMSRRSQSAVSLSSLGRVSRSVDRDVGIGATSTITTTTSTTSRTFDYDRSTPSRSSTTSSGRLQSTPRPPLPTILSRRRYSVSSAAGDRITRDASPSTFLDAGGGIDDDDGGYRRRRTPISWSRKDVVYTADGMRSVLNGTLAPGTNHTAATPRRSPSLSKYDYSATAAATAARNRSRRRLENDADDVDLSYVGSSVDDVDEARRRARESRSRSRAASLSRVENTVAGGGSGVDTRRRTHRAASVVYTASSASTSSNATTNSNFLRTSSSDAALRRLSSRRFSLPATAAVIRPPYTASTARYYNGTGAGLTAPVFGATMPDGDGLDLTAFVLAPGEKFVPTDVRVSLLPSGKQAITYTRFSQKGHGDQTQANAEIERIIQRTRRMQDQMHTLETFVQRNRSLFPEDIIIYQHIIFYLLDEAELRRLGERRTDAEVYGVKIRERLVAPYGTDVASILKRYYSRYDEVDVEYTDTEEIRRRLRDEGVAEEAPSSGGGGRRRYRTDVEEVETTEETATGRRPNGRRPSPLDDDLLVVRRRPSSRDRSTSQGLYIDESLIGVEDLQPGSRRRRSRQEAAPQFTARLHPKRIRAGDTMRLNCSVTGEPEPKVTWYYGKEQIHNDGYYNISNTFGLCSLKVLSVGKNDSGCYTARATNHLGEVSTSADIIVEDDEETVAADTERGTRKPWFVVDARNTFAEAGQRAVFEAQAIGTPPPTFKWKKDNVDVILDNRVRVVSDDLGNTKLVIRDVRSTDAGVYFCIAENSAGKAKCAATLRVINADETDHRAPVDNDSFLLNNKQTVYQFDDDATMSRGRWPQFVQTPPLHIDVYEGDPLTLRCVVEGDPTPVVTWYKGVRELTYSERHRVIAEGEGSHLMQIKSTLQTDPGEYTAVATNSCGHSKFTTVVNVLPRPRQDDDQQMSKPKPVEREFELVKRMEQGKMPPIFIIKLPREKTIKLGQTLLFDCHIEEAKMRQYLVGVDIVVKDKPDLHPDVKITSTAPDEQLQQQITSEQPVSA